MLEKIVSEGKSGEKKGLYELISSIFRFRQVMQFFGQSIQPSPAASADLDKIPALQIPQ
jgi:hypothetical protein